MAAPVETNLSNLSVHAPWFARKVNSGSATLEKFSGDETQYAEIRQPLSRAVGAGITLTMDVPVTIRRARFLLENAVVTVSDQDFGSLKLCDLPDRNIAILQAELVGSVIFAGDYATNDDPDVAVGTAAASNATLATTMVDVIAKVDFDNITAGAANAVAMSRVGATAALSPLLVADGASNALYLNVGNAADQLSADGTATFNGYFDVWYVDLGNVGS